MKTLGFFLIAIFIIQAAGINDIAPFLEKHKGWMDSAKKFHPAIYTQLMEDCKDYCNLKCELIKKDLQPQVYDQCWSAISVCVDAKVCN